MAQSETVDGDSVEATCVLKLNSIVVTFICDIVPVIVLCHIFVTCTRKKASKNFNAKVGHKIYFSEINTFPVFVLFVKNLNLISFARTLKMC